MKRAKKPKSFSVLLVKTYAILTIELILCILLVQLFASHQLDKVMPAMRVPELLQEIEQAPQHVYSPRSLARYLGDHSYLQVYYPNGALLSSSGDLLEAEPLTQAERDILPDFTDGGYTESIPFTDEQGNERYVLTRLVLPGAVEQNNDFIILDAEYRVVASSRPLEKTSFTPREVALFSGAYPEGRSLYREEIVSRDGVPLTVVLGVKKFSEQDYARAIAFWQYSWILVALLYVVFIAITIIWLNRKTQRLLRPLGESIDSLLSNKPSRPIAYEGPREFTEIYTRFNTLAERLSESEAQRRKLDNARDTLLANISHDLKTPVTVIQGYAKAIHDGVIPPEEQPRYVETIYRKSVHLTHLLGSFFEYSKLRHPSLPLNLQKEDLTEFFTEYLAEKHQEIELAGYLLEVDLPERKLFCPVDRMLLRRAIDNLLANALQYNPRGTTIYFRLEPCPEGACMQFADDGTGIAAFGEKDFFEPFVIADEARAQEGTGLGLAITASILKLHGGDIRLAPPEGRWKTVFLLRISSRSS